MDIKVDTFHFGNVSVELNTYGQDLDQSDYDQKHNYRSPVIDYVGNGEEIDFEITVRNDFDQAGSMTLLIIFMTDGDGTTGDGFDNTYKRWQSDINMNSFQKKFNATEEQFTTTYHVNVSTQNSNYPGQWLQYIRFRLYYAKEDYPYCPIKSITIHSDEYWDMVQLAPHPVGAPMISDAVATSPYPNALWQIDGVHNNGFPFIVLMPYLPYTPILPDQEAINFLDKVRVRSLPHGVNQDFIVSKVSIPLSKPEETKYSLGKKLASTFTESTNSINSKIAEQIKQVPKVSKVLKSAKENAAALINSATNGYVTMVQEDGHTKEIVISEEPDYLTSQNVWRWNQNGLAHSSTGYDGGEDGFNMAITMDGSIVADRITTGTMQADRIRGGELLLGGYDYDVGNNGVLSLISGKTKDDLHETVRLDKDGAYIEGTTVSANRESGFTMVLDDGHIYSYKNYNRDKPMGGAGEHPEYNEMVGYIHMTNSVGADGGEPTMGMGFYCQGPLLFNMPGIAVGHDFNDLLAIPNNAKIKLLEDVTLVKTGENSYDLEKTYKTLEFRSGWCENEK